MKKSWCLTIAAIFLFATVPLGLSAQESRPFTIGVVTFLSGAPAGPFGIPAKIAAEVFAEQVNAGGKLPAPYDKVGFGGRPIELVIIDEAGGTTKQVSELRNLVERQSVDMIVGYTSSGDCLAVAPVAEELKTMTLFSSIAARRASSRKLTTNMYSDPLQPRRWTTSVPLSTSTRQSRNSTPTPASTKTTPGVRTPGTTSKAH